MGYRPFGRFQRAGLYPVGDQWPEPPDDLRELADGPEVVQLNRFERFLYRLLSRPSLLPRLGWRRRA